jgi:hypothetical protein
MPLQEQRSCQFEEMRLFRAIAAYLCMCGMMIDRAIRKIGQFSGGSTLSDI